MIHIKKHWRKYICIVFFLFLGATTSVRAADPDVVNGTNMSGNLFNTDHEVTSSGSPAYYQLDVTSKTGEEEGGLAGAFNTIGSWISGDAVKDEVMAQMYEGLNFLVNIAFKANVYMTNAMLTVLDYAFKFDVINTIIDKVEGIMQDLTGISGLKFSSLGLYGQLLGIICVAAVLGFVIQYFFKKAQMEAVGKIARTILILVFTLIFFTNYATILKGANTLTTQLTAVVMGSTSALSSEDGKTGQQSIGDNMWDLFVHRPYLYMQYGVDDASKIGDGRVDTLLAMQPGEDRQTYVEETEVGERKNTMMTYAKVPDRLVFTIMYLVVNGITSLPIFALALLIIAFQFWFLVLALLAPIFLLIAAFPGNDGVFRRYIEELTLPLLLKIGVSFIALVIFTMSAIVYEVGNSDSIGYVAVAVIEFVVLFLIFMLRKRLLSILAAGNTAVRMVAHEAAKADQRFDDTRRMVKKLAVQAAMAAATGGTSLAATGAAGAAAAAGGAMSNKDSASNAAALANESLKDEDTNTPVDADHDNQDLHDNLDTESLYGEDPGAATGTQEDLPPAKFLRERRQKNSAAAAAAAVGLAGGTIAADGKSGQSGTTGLPTAGSPVAGSTHDNTGSGMTASDHAGVPTESLNNTDGDFYLPSFLRTRPKRNTEPSHSGNAVTSMGGTNNHSPGHSNIPYLEAVRGTDSYANGASSLQSVPLGDDASLFASAPIEAPPETGQGSMGMNVIPAALHSFGNRSNHVVQNTAYSAGHMHLPVNNTSSIGAVPPVTGYNPSQAPSITPIVGMHTTASTPPPVPPAVQALGQSLQTHSAPPVAMQPPTVQPAPQAHLQSPTVQPAPQTHVQSPTVQPAPQAHVQPPTAQPAPQVPVQPSIAQSSADEATPDVLAPIIHQSAGTHEVVERRSVIHNTTRPTGTNAAEKTNNSKGNSSFAKKSDKTTKLKKEDIKTSQSLPSLSGAGGKEYKPEVHERPDRRQAADVRTVSLNDTPDKKDDSDL